MSVTPSPIGGFAAQFFDNNGVILSGGKIYTYAAGTTTPQATYTSASGTTPHANPIILDSAGRVPGGEIWLTDGLVYKFVIETATGSLLGTYDNITGVNSNFVNYTIQEEVITATAGQTVFNLSTINYTPGTNSLTVYIDGVNQYVGDSYIETDSDTVTFTSGVHVGGEVKFTTAIQTTTGAVDASIVTYDPPFTGGVITNVEDKLAQTVSVKDFGAVGDGVADDTAAFATALATQDNLYIPEGTYLLDDVLIDRVGVSLVGAGQAHTTLKARSVVNKFINVQGDPSTVAFVIRDIQLQGFTIDGDGKADIGLSSSVEISPNFINDVRITGTLQEGMKHWRGWSCGVQNLSVDYNSGNGVTLVSEANNWEMLNVNCNHNDGYGLTILSGTGVRITGGFENNGEQGVIIKSVPLSAPYSPTRASFIDLTGCYIENNGTTNYASFPNIELGGGTDDTTNIMLNSCTINGATNSTGIYVKSGVLNFHLINTNISWVSASPLLAAVRFLSSVTTIYDLVYANIVSSNNFINGPILVDSASASFNEEVANFFAGGGARGNTFIGNATAADMDFKGSGASGKGKSRMRWWRDSELEFEIGVDPNVSGWINAPNPVGSLKLGTTGDENVRINTDGFFKASDVDATYIDPAGAYHELNQSNSTQPVAQFHNTSAVPNGVVLYNSVADPNNSTQYFILATSLGNDKFKVLSNGNVVNVTGTYGTISDAKLKENVTDSSDYLDRLCQIRMVNYNLKTNPDQKLLGVIAQEVEQVFPSLVEEAEDFAYVEKERVNDNGVVETYVERTPLGTTTKSVKMSVFIPMLMKAVQELKTEIDTLKAGA